MLKQWFLKTFFRKRILLENIFMELRNIHYHIDRIEAFYMMKNNIKENEEKIINKNSKN